MPPTDRIERLICQANRYRWAALNAPKDSPDSQTAHRLADAAIRRAKEEARDG